jgi:SpoVK/Ycf46/Vps4 family AAA+-type ATPase
MEPEKGSYEGDRRKTDLEQAQMMARSLKRSSEPQAVDINNIHLGMRGLDEADSLQRQGSLHESLKLYGLSIELLLKCLRFPSPDVSKETLSQRISSGLEEAERVKAKLKASSLSPAQSTSQSSHEGGTSSSWTSYLSSALTTAINCNQTSTSNAPITKAPPSNQSAPATKSPTKNVQLKRSNLDYANDPLVQQVKNDLYIDPSELQHTTWNDIAGLERAKQSLQEAAILPLLRPDLFRGLRKPQNILLYGPPGTGKTMLVKAVAHESKCLLFSCSASTLTSKWHGEGEKLVRTLFKVARDAAPSLIFVDEMDSLLSSRNDNEHEASRRFKTEFMVQMDGMSSQQEVDSHLLVLGCTNCPWNVDDAILRRFPRRIYIPLPDIEARTVLLQNLLSKAGKHTLTKRQVSQLAQTLDGFSCSDISSVASEASFGPLRSLGGVRAIQSVRDDEIRPINVKDFEAAVTMSTKSVSPAILQRYAQWEKQQAAK